ncbi:MAG TPA: TldD/PmbA family protein, partial [Nitrososphaera sp.]
TIENSGVSIRSLVKGCWGFSSVYSTSNDILENCVSTAIATAKALSTTKRDKVKGLKSPHRIIKGVFEPNVKGRLEDIGIDTKINTTKEAESEARRHSEYIKSAYSSYLEILDHKIIVNSDGAEFETFDSKPEFNITCIANSGGDSITASEGRGVTGGWKDLFEFCDHFQYARMASDRAIKLLEAKHVLGEKSTVILDPGMVGLISHEAIGHMVEADFVLSGSIVKDKLDSIVASEKVTLIDSGRSPYSDGAAGTMAVDDEGVIAGDAILIENGMLKSFLHNRETAFLFDVEPTGNARAFEYTDEPIIRMRNTFIKPGNDKLEDIIKETKYGYLVKGPRNGQADANGEFMFGAQELHLIEGGEIKCLKRGATISGNAFDVLKSVDMVGNDFAYGIGTGYCGKFQVAKVDGGGPHIRCTATVGSLG